MAQSERTVVVSRENPLSLGCLIKATFTCGIYLLWWYAKRLEVTNRRVIFRTGLIGKDERTVPLDKVQDISVRYGILGRILGYGDIRIESSGGSSTEIVAKNFTNPEGVKRSILNR